MKDLIVKSSCTLVISGSSHSMTREPIKTLYKPSSPDTSASHSSLPTQLLLELLVEERLLQDGQSYSLECQAVGQITCQFPLVKLDPISAEACDSVPHDTIFPSEIGGEEVKLLVSIRQTGLTPRLIMTLPSGH